MLTFSKQKTHQTYFFFNPNRSFTTDSKFIGNLFSFLNAVYFKGLNVTYVQNVSSAK